MQPSSYCSFFYQGNEQLGAGVVEQVGAPGDGEVGQETYIKRFALS